jgi:Holliday junction DNA helicase RuvB
VDRSILTTIGETYQGGPVGLETIAAIVGEDSDTLEEVYEPYLMRKGLLERTPRGRKIPESARARVHTFLQLTIV